MKTDPIVDAVREDLHRRSQLGIMKYGTTLDDNPASLKEKLQHAYEEALDLANYLRWAIDSVDQVLNRDPVTGKQKPAVDKSRPAGCSDPLNPTCECIACWEALECLR